MGFSDNQGTGQGKSQEPETVIEAGMARHQSQATREKIRQSLKGHAMSEGTRAMISKSMIRQFAEGIRINRLSEAGRKRLSEVMKENIRSGKINPHRPCPESAKAKLRLLKISDEHKAIIRRSALKQAAEGRMNMEGLKLGPTIGLPKMWEKNRGSNGFGSNERGNLKHCNACAWRVRSPAGIEYEFTNAREWCRNNEHLFDDKYPESKTPLWLRASNMFSRLNESGCSWCGWTLVASFELEDFLNRKIT